MDKLKSEARKFILDNSPKWQEAAEHGYDLRMEESELLEWMVRYRNAAPKMKVAQRCPICQGEGRVPTFYGSTSTGIFTVCTVCSGLKIVIVEQG
jgi:hypothetical protein